MSGELEKAQDLYLEEAAFRLFCKQLVLHSQALGDGWVWEDMKESEDGYLKKTLLKAGAVSALCRDGGQRSPRDEPAELELEAQAFSFQTGRGAWLRGWGWRAAGTGQRARRCEKRSHKLRGGGGTASQASGRPASGLRGDCARHDEPVTNSQMKQALKERSPIGVQQGRPLALEEIWAGVHEHYRERLLQGPWDTITQQEHPLLGQPFFALHPCRTQEFMSPIVTAAKGENRSLNYIAAWLSVVGPVVGLSLPLSYATAASPSPAAPD
ncbi:ATG10 enzyme, partial [Atractosteus spatula]|nr:ATG10 enzyme [Atractosteus spatula]